MLALTLLLLQVANQLPKDVVVLGQRTQRALDRCLAQNCPTPEDTRLSIAHAETLFAQGDYAEARATLRASIQRQKINVAQFPRFVAALYEANATVNLHLGDMDEYRSAVIGQNRAIRDNLPDDDPQALLMAVRLGDFWIKQRQPRAARIEFEGAARAYAQRGDQTLHALCQLRVIAIDIALRDFAGADSRLRKTSSSPAASDPTVRKLSAVMAARLAAARGKDVDVDTLLATLRTEVGSAPVLIRPGKEPFVAGVGAAQPLPKFETIARGLGSGERRHLKWADIGFMIGPDGQVGDPEVLRGSRARDWTQPYLSEITSRRYAPINLPPGQPGLYRVERYTLRSERVMRTGSLIKQSAGRRYAEVLDMTRDKAVPRRADR